jgi:uncharacterized protein YndB with AHSA1/START domain
VIAGHTVHLQLRIEATPDVVFPFLTVPELYARWQGVRAELDPRPGGVFRVWMDADTVASGAFIEVQSPRVVVFTWGWEGDAEVPPGSTTVRIELSADGDATLLTLEHSGLPTDRAASTHEEGWRLFGSRLAAVASGEDPGPMPAPPAPGEEP